MMWLKNVLFILLHPNYWLMLDNFNKNYDDYLNRLMDENKFELVSEYEAKIGPLTLWIANHPYRSFTPHPAKSSKSPFRGYRPSRMTIRKAYKKLISDCSA